MEKNYWICNTTYDNWILCKKDLSWGVPEVKGGTQRVYGIEQLSRVKVGDGVFFYAQKHGIIGYFAVVSNMFDDDRMWIDRKYPYRIKLKETKTLLCPIPFMDIRNKIYNQQSASVISNGASLHGKSMIPISLNDAKYLLKLIEL